METDYRKEERALEMVNFSYVSKDTEGLNTFLHGISDIYRILHPTQ